MTMFEAILFTLIGIGFAFVIAELTDIQEEIKKIKKLKEK